MFEKYQRIEYPIDIDGVSVTKILADISTSLKIADSVTSNFGYFDRYTIRSGDTPESVAYKAYGNPKLHYLVMLVNNRFDWRNDFPLTDEQIESVCNEKYKDINGIHHYINVETNEIVTPIYDEDELDRSKRFISVEDQVYTDDGELALHIVPVTNREYEEEVNEGKRHITLIKKQYVSQVDSAIKALL